MTFCLLEDPDNCLHAVPPLALAVPLRVPGNAACLQHRPLATTLAANMQRGGGATTLAVHASRRVDSVMVGL